jgi:hypothetical protein
MQSLAAAAIGLLIIASILVALRLLMLYRRTGAWPELLLGGMLLLSVGVSYPLRIAVRASHEWAGTLLVTSEIAVGVGFSLLFVFTWRVFRPQATWARIVVAGGVIALVAAAVRGCIQVQTQGAIDVTDESLGGILLQTGPVIVGYLWTGWEALRYHGAMRRRVRLGLADAVVSNRFLLWGVMAASATLGVALNTWAAVLHVDTLSSPWVLLPSSITGLLQAVMLLLAFVPPQSYMRWIRMRPDATGG